MNLTHAFASVFVMGLLAPMEGTIGIKPAVTNPGPAQLEFSLEPSKGKFVLYEPVFLTCTLKNPEARSIIANVMSLDLMDRHVMFGDSTRKISPGQVLDGALGLFFNDIRRDLAFPRVGRYTIHGKIFLGNHPAPIFVNASPVQIEVAPAQGVDIRVTAALGSEERLVSLLTKGSREFCENDPGYACSKSLDRLVEDLPDSVYTPSIALDLAISAGHDYPERPANYGRVVKRLERFLVRWPNHPLAPAAMTFLATTMKNAGDQKAAMEWVYRFEKEYPNRDSPRKSIEYRGADRGDAAGVPGPETPHRSDLMHRDIRLTGRRHRCR